MRREREDWLRKTGHYLFIVGLENNMLRSAVMFSNRGFYKWAPQQCQTKLKILTTCRIDTFAHTSIL